jgi:hypothetical protein
MAKSEWWVAHDGETQVDPSRGAGHQVTEAREIVFTFVKPQISFRTLKEWSRWLADLGGWA